jgi:hypothetical protein
MPQILVMADSLGETPDAIVYRERIATADLESDYFSGQLVERVGWAVLDADQLEAEARASVGNRSDSTRHLPK